MGDGSGIRRVPSGATTTRTTVITPTLSPITINEHTWDLQKVAEEYGTMIDFGNPSQSKVSVVFINCLQRD